MRNAFVDTITQMAEKDDKVVLLTADVGYKIFDNFIEKFPNRFYNVGIAEANMIGMASGLALEGFKPYVYSMVPFVTMRCCEQIKVDLCYNKRNVVVVGIGGGYSYGHNGCTHHGIEDIAIMRSIPEMKVICPGDPNETISLVKKLVNENNGPCYLRLGRAGEEKVHLDIPDLNIGQSIVIGELGKDINIISTGNMLSTAIKAKEKLQFFNIHCGVISMPSVKPLDYKMLDEVRERCSCIVTLEEHNLCGGFGSAISEYVIDIGCLYPPIEIKRIGIKDNFIKISGDQDYLRKISGLSVDKIVEQIVNWWRN